MRGIGRYCEGGVESAWLFALVLTPLFFNVYSFRIFEPDKVALFRSLALLAIAGWLAGSLITRGVAAAERLRALAAACRRPLAAPVLTIAAAHLASTAFSVTPTESLFGSYYRLQGTLTTLSYLVFFAAVAAHVRRRQQVRRVLATVALTSLPIALYAVVQHLGWDPLEPWGDDVRSRPPATLGNPIFLGGYLAMSALVVLALMTTSVHAAVAREPHRGRHVASAFVYAVIFVLNLVAMGLAESRGPILALCAGLACFWILVAAVGRFRRLALVALALAALPPLVIVLLTARAGDLAPQQRSVGVRILIWEGLLDLTMPHAPLTFPDGRTDEWHRLRPLIGYGPESIGLVFNLVKRPELQRLNESEAFVDRAHNEVLDVWATTGLVGVAGVLGLFIAIFYSGLRWLGLIDSRTRRRAFWALLLSACAVSVAAAWSFWSPALVGLAMSVGIVAAVLMYAAISAFMAPGRATAPRPVTDVARAVMFIALLAAIVAHAVEISVGIATVSTRAHFWVFAALLPAAARPESSEEHAVPAPWREGVLSAVLMTLVLVTIAYSFVTVDVRAVGWGRAPAPGASSMHAGTPWGIALVLFLVTWLVGVVLACCSPEQQAPARGRAWLAMLLGAPLAVGAVAWTVTSWQVAALTGITAADLPSLLSVTGRLANLLTSYAVVVLCLLVVAMLAAAAPGPPDRGPGAFGPGSLTRTGALLTCAALAMAALWLAYVLNLRPIRADTFYNVARRLGAEQKALTVGLYRRAISLAPNEPYYERELRRLPGR